MSLQDVTQTFAAFGPLATPERWTLQSGTALITTEVILDTSQGIVMVAGNYIDLPAGVTVRARSISNDSRAISARFNRENALLTRGQIGSVQSPTPAAASVAVINTDLLSGTVNGWFDATGMSYLSATIIGSAGISAGAIIFEGTNDITLQPAGQALLVMAEVGVATMPAAGAITIAASTARTFVVPIPTKYVRCRASTAFAGGTVQAINYCSATPAPNYAEVRQLTSANLNVQPFQATPANLNMTMTPATATMHALNSAATTNATSVKTTTTGLMAILLSNLSPSIRFFKIYSKSSAPVVGTDVPIATIPIPANSFISVPLGPNGLRVSVGLAYAITAAQPVTDTTAIGAGEVEVLLTYI